ncbi:MAG: cytochrome c biogenesis protein CcsA [Deltaproteobacteria bacterium]|nr:cytochrome c biogenesis protein CcsA [Deltaproteobacteria bacterium]
MSAASLVTFGASVLAYLGSSALFYWDVAKSRGSEVRPLATGLLGVALLSHGSYVTIASAIAHVCPVHSLQFMLSMASLLASTSYLLGRRWARIDALGLLVAPLGLVLTLGTFFLSIPQPTRRLPASFIGLHVLASLAGFAMFLLAFGAAVLYLVQERRLKSKRLPEGGLPALDVLDRAVHRFLVAGFPLLTLAVVTGTVWAKTLESGTAQEILRNVLSYATWGLFAVVLGLRVVGGWRGRRAAYGTVAGFACVLVVLALYLVRPLLGDGGT